MTDSDKTGPIDSVTVPVALGERAYDIVNGDGALTRAGELIRAALPKARACIVTDANVAKRLLATLVKSLRRADVTASAIVIPAGEAS